MSVHYLKPEQKECVSYIYKGKDAFSWLPPALISQFALPFVFDVKLGPIGA